MAHTLILDVECKEKKDEDERWSDYRARAGVALACVYCVENDEYEFYGSEDLEELAKRLEGAREVIGYNNVWFDHPVIDFALGRRLIIPRETDIWRVIQAACAERWPRGSWRLGAVCHRTFGEEKGGNGALAPDLARDGKWGKLVTYLTRDVWLTKRLYEFITANGYVISPDDKKLMVGVKDA